MEAGDVTFSAPANGKVTVTITLKPGWFFDNVLENVKIQDYASTPPSRNPSPGQFAWKGYASRCSFSMDVPANYYYGVHVDLFHVAFLH
jgi:hypothetical protein